MAAPHAESIGATKTLHWHFDEALDLECGHVLPGFDLAYETYGRLSPTRDNVILACHALSGDAHAAGTTAGGAASAVDGVGAGQRAQEGLGWWDGMIGPGRAFDTTRYFVVCINVLGSCRGSTGPRSIDPLTSRRYDSNFPIVTVADMVRAQRRLTDALDIRGIAATTGGSLGGMQALEWAVRYPAFVRSCIPIASTASLSPMGLAWSSIGRNAIMADPKWRGGRYPDDDPPDSGLAVARMVGHVTYLSSASIAEKFGRRLQDRQSYSYGFDADFEVESYLRHQGAKFVKRFDANSYLYLSRALSYFDLGGQWGGGSLPVAMARARARFLVLSFSSDWLYPPADSARLVEAILQAGGLVESHVVESNYGHDAFLVEEARQTTLIRDFLERLDA